MRMLRVGLLGLLILGTVPVGAQSSHLTASQHRARAKQALQAEDYDRAISELQAAARLAPKDATTFYSLGIVLKLQSKNTDAAQALRNAVRLGLPPDKKAKANAMLEELRTTNQTAGAEAQSRPKLEETLDWLRSELPTLTSFKLQCSGEGANGEMAYSVTNVDFDGCSMKLTLTREDAKDWLGRDGDRLWYKSIESLPLDIMLNSLVTDVAVQPSQIEGLGGGPEACAGTLTSVRLRPATGDLNVVITGNLYYGGRTDPINEKRQLDAIAIVFNDQTKAERIARAFSDAIRGCGGKEIKNIY